MLIQADVISNLWIANVICLGGIQGHFKASAAQVGSAGTTLWVGLRTFVWYQDCIACRHQPGMCMHHGIVLSTRKRTVKGPGQKIDLFLFRRKFNFVNNLL